MLRVLAGHLAQTGAVDLDFVEKLFVRGRRLVRVRVELEIHAGG